MDESTINLRELAELLTLASKKMNAVLTYVWEENNDDKLMGSWHNCEIYADLNEDGTAILLEITPPSAPLRVPAIDVFEAKGPFDVLTINRTVHASDIEETTQIIKEKGFASSTITMMTSDYKLIAMFFVEVPAPKPHGKC